MDPVQSAVLIYCYSTPCSTTQELGNTMYCCTICQSFASPMFSAVLWHIGNTHAADSHLSLKCPIPGCTSDPYNKYESFRSHIYRKHRSVLGRGLPSLSCSCTGTDPDAPGVSSVLDGESDSSMDATEPEENTPSTSIQSIQHRAAHFLLKTQEERKLTQKALDGIMHDMTDLWDMSKKQDHN